MAMIAADVADPRVLPRTLAGATVLQIVPTLRDDAKVRAAIDAARALVQLGARGIIAGEPGVLVSELQSFGGEFLPFATSSFNPARIRANARALEQLVSEHRIDIIHAKSAGAAWSALSAARKTSIGFVTDLPDLPPARMRIASFYLSVLSRGDRVIAPSMFSAQPMIQRHKIPLERVSIIPRSIDLATYDQRAVRPERVTALRHAWGIPSGVEIVLVPGRVAPWNGQIALVEAAHMLTEEGVRGITFVLAGDDERHKRYARAILAEAREKGVDALFRLVGHCSDMPAAFAAADVVVVPYREPPVLGRVVAEAQAMGRPVVTTSVGPLPENLVTPPYLPEELRTGWVIEPDDPAELVLALRDAFDLDAEAYRAMSARARQFAEFMFLPERIAIATLEVYASLLETKE